MDPILGSLKAFYRRLLDVVTHLQTAAGSAIWRGRELSAVSDVTKVASHFSLFDPLSCSRQDIRQSMQEHTDLIAGLRKHHDGCVPGHADTQLSRKCGRSYSAALLWSPALCRRCTSG